MATPRQVLDLLGLEYFERNNRLMMCCPFHDDTDPSSGFYEDTELFHCFACSYTFDPTRFYAKYQGIDYNRAEQDLERRFGEKRVATASINKTKNVAERAKAERALAELKPVLDRQQFCPLGELLDEILLKHIRGDRTDSDVDIDLRMWYSMLKEASNEPRTFDPGRASRTGPYARIKERMADLPGPGGSDGEIDLD